MLITKMVDLYYICKGEPGEKGSKGAAGRAGRLGPPGENGTPRLLLIIGPVFQYPIYQSIY